MDCASSVGMPPSCATNEPRRPTDEGSVCASGLLETLRIQARQASERNRFDRDLATLDAPAPGADHLAVHHDRRLEHAIAARYHRRAVFGREDSRPVPIAQNVLVE